MSKPENDNISPEETVGQTPEETAETSVPAGPRNRNRASFSSRPMLLARTSLFSLTSEKTYHTLFLWARSLRAGSSFSEKKLTAKPMTAANRPALTTRNRMPTSLPPTVTGDRSP